MSLFSSLTGWTWEQVISGFATKFSLFMGSRLGKWITSALAFIGIDLAAYSTAVGPFIDHARASWAGMSGQAMQWIHFFRIDQCITIVLSAYTLAAIKRIVFRKRS